MLEMAPEKPINTYFIDGSLAHVANVLKKTGLLK